MNSKLYLLPLVAFLLLCFYHALAQGVEIESTADLNLDAGTPSIGSLAADHYMIYDGAIEVKKESPMISSVTVSN